MTPSGIEPATLRFVAQYLNHCATISGPRILEGAGNIFYSERQQQPTERHALTSHNRLNSNNTAVRTSNPSKYFFVAG
jgi:hypothetical protein